MTNDGPASSPPATAGEVVRGCCASAAAAWLDLVQPARDNAPDAVHQLRVTSRRLRSLLRNWSGVLADDHASTVRELRWFARALGEVRDLEVLEGRLLDQTSGVTAEHVRRELDADREAARRVLAVDLGSPRLARLRGSVESLTGVAVNGEWERRSASALVLLASSAAHRALAAWDAVALLPGEAATSAQLLGTHHARRVAKAVRYQCEALHDQDPALGTWPLAEAFHAVGDELGEVQDTVVAEQYAWQLASRTDDALVRAVLDAVARDEAGRRPEALDRGRRALATAARLLA